MAPFPLPTVVLESVVSMLSTVSQCGTVSSAHCGVGKCRVFVAVNQCGTVFLCPVPCWKVSCSAACLLLRWFSVCVCVCV